MSFYQHLQAIGRFVTGFTGIKVFQASIIIPLTQNTTDYFLEEKSSVERNYAVGLWVVDPEDTPQKITTTKTVAAAAVWNSAHLQLRKDQEIMVDKLYLRDIKKANDNGHPYYLNLGDKINLSESKLVVNNSSAISPDEAVEIKVDYVKPKV